MRLVTPPRSDVSAAWSPQTPRWAAWLKPVVAFLPSAFADAITTALRTPVTLKRVRLVHAAVANDIG